MGRRRKHWSDAMFAPKPSTAMFRKPVERTPSVQFAKGVADGATSVGRGTWRAVLAAFRIGRWLR
ncbi:hypothetical protein SEA_DANIELLEIGNACE_68 [Arthrobacter phage DanielleIgnace]|nr:hypothetical protein SEA_DANIELLEIGNACE_68 [Arthrobacter phage DanielleIgnace]